MSMKSLKGNEDVIIYDLPMKKNVGLPHKIKNNLFLISIKDSLVCTLPKWITNKITLF